MKAIEKLYAQIESKWAFWLAIGLFVAVCVMCWLNGVDVMDVIGG